jgi:uncharacterized protein (TIGR03086 family)
MASPGSSADVLASAIRYALGSLTLVTPESLSRPTPCAAWDLAALLEHVGDSLAALHDGIAAGQVGLDRAALTPAHPDLVATLRDRAGRLLAASVVADGLDLPVAIADRWLPGTWVAAVGAVEIAVHGWDIPAPGRARQPIPSVLASRILAIVPLVVTDVTRHARFAAPVAAASQASPGDRLVALLGRNP